MDSPAATHPLGSQPRDADAAHTAPAGFARRDGALWSDLEQHDFSSLLLNATTPAGISSEDIEPSPPFVPSWRPDEFVLNQGYQAYREELRYLIFSTAQSVAPTREPSPADGEAEGAVEGGTEGTLHLKQSGTDSHRIRRETAKILATGRRVVYLRNYIEQVAPWLDMFDSDRAFGMQVPSIARASPALMYAVLALSSRQMERKEDRKSTFDSLELYQEAIRLLAPLLQSRDLSIIPICVILCCLEMMSASAQDWRRHLEGCAALFKTFGVSGFSGGLLQAVFWCYARMDLCGALISDGTQSTLVPPPEWLPPGTKQEDARIVFRETQRPDMHANYAVYLGARVCELISLRTRHVELGEQNICAGDGYEGHWRRLWDELQAWLQDRPPEFHPIKTVDKQPFPEILFVHWAAISSNQLHHTACVLMLGALPKAVKLGRQLGPSGSVLWHARRICGISQTNPHQGCLNNAIQPLWVAGRLFSHKTEHEAIVKTIWSIDALTGWGARWRIQDLEAAWGYKVKRTS
ncbi:hypothetical protein GQ53DRAFT_633710 [Thozetella sp. PMI_491]|nr:hypothetical protein GQ53DRAFT_633710 [Thozetella sp. PMI_491]